jgi:hypothetical protein
MRVQNFLLPRLEGRHHKDPEKGNIDGLSQKGLKRKKAENSQEDLKSQMQL